MISTLATGVYLLRGSTRGRRYILTCVEKIFGLCMCCTCKPKAGNENVFAMSCAVEGFQNDRTV